MTERFLDDISDELLEAFGYDPDDREHIEERARLLHDKYGDKIQQLPCTQCGRPQILLKPFHRMFPDASYSTDDNPVFLAKTSRQYVPAHWGSEMECADCITRYGASWEIEIEDAIGRILTDHERRCIYANWCLITKDDDDDFDNFLTYETYYADDVPRRICE